MAGMLTEVGTYLAAQLTLTKATDLFEGIMPPSPDACLSINDFPGAASTLGFGVTTGVQLENPGLQVLTRGEAGDYDTPRNQAHNARQALAKVQGMTLSGTDYELIIPQQSPFILDRDDDDERIVFAFNCRVRKEPS